MHNIIKLLDTRLCVLFMLQNEENELFVEKIKLALAFQNSGRMQESESVFKELVEKYPVNSDVLNLIGVFYYQTARYSEAVAYMTKAIGINPLPVTFLNLGHAFVALKNFGKAVESYQKAISLDPQYIDAYMTLGRVLSSLNHKNESILCYQQVISINPENFSAYNSLGLIYRGMDKYSEAINCYTKAIELKPDFTESVFNMANVLRISSNPDEALNYYRRAIELKPDFPEAYNNMGAVLNEKNDKIQAEICYKKAIEINPKFVESYCNLASIREEQGKIEEALALCRKAIEINPSYEEAYNKIGVMLYYNKRFDEAENWYRKALIKFPDSEEIHFNLGTIQILKENFEECWQNYNYRHFKNPEQKKKLGMFRKPLWRGEPINGKTLFTYHEQGLGDSLQFVRYFPLLKQMGVNVIFKCQKPLIELFKQNYPDIEITDDLIDENILNFDAFLPLLNIQGAFRTNLNNIPTPEKYIEANPDKVNYYKNTFFNNDKFKLGIFWQGSANNKNDKNRSISLDFFSEFEKMENVSLYSLQKGVGEEQLTNSSLNITHLGNTFNDFSDTAAALANLDLLITVDTAIAHLAGAMGIPTWILIPFMPCWRWFLDRVDSPWYDSVMLFRQREAGNWEEVKQRMMLALKEKVSGNYSPLLIQTMIGEEMVCSRVRITEPNSFLSLIPGVRTTEAIKTADLGVGEKFNDKIFIWQRVWPGGTGQQKQLLSKNYIIVNEIDDDPFRWEDDFKRNNFFTFRSCHGIQTSTEPLAECLREYNPNVKVFQNQLAYLPPPRSYNDYESSTINLFFGALNREEDWKPILPVLNKVLSGYGSKIKVKVIYDKLFFNSITATNKEYYPFCPYNVYENILRQCDIAILPLEPNRFNRMKSDLKFIECAGHGVAVLASPTVYANTLEDGKTGLIFNSLNEFEENLVKLIENVSFRWKLIQNAYEYVAQNRMLIMHYRERYDWYSEMLSNRSKLNEELRIRVPELYF